jgi:hypothetical protein
MQLRIKREGCKKMVVEADTSYHVITLKFLIWEMCYIHPSTQRLYFNNSELADLCRLSDYDICDDCAIYMEH